MPRAKVKPHDRIRSARACVACKTSKIKCDGNSPCATCKRRAREDSCVFDDLPTAATNISRQRRHSRLTSNASSVQGHAGFSGAPWSPEQSDTSLSHEKESPKSRMLLSSTLQKVYVGESAALSYLHFLRHVLKVRMGPSQFTENTFSDYMLEQNVTCDGEQTLSSFDSTQWEALVQSYIDATSGILDLCRQPDIVAALQQAFSEPCSISTATLYLVLAIGAQCRGTKPGDADTSATMFSKARAMVFENMLSDPSTSMIAEFLLMAFYLLGACHRNAAFMYLGVAKQAANALGLQKACLSSDLSPEECNIRMRAWKSLRVLDTIVSTILGRHSSTAPGRQSIQDSQEFRFAEPGNESPQSKATQASFDICPYLDELATGAVNQTVGSAECFLQRLRRWCQALPLELRNWNEAQPVADNAQPLDRVLYIGRTHVACVYYFAVILATRQCLTEHLLAQLRHEASVSSSATSRLSSNSRSSGLAHVCLDAAVKLARVSHDTMTSQQMMGNMCLMKAWVFAAGLILGFAHFVQPSGSDVEVEHAFRQCCAVEQKLAALSPQAGHYYEILASLGDAIASSRDDRANQRKRIASQYMDPFFTANSNVVPLTDMSTSIPSDDMPAQDPQYGSVDSQWDPALASSGSNQFANSNTILDNQGTPFAMDDFQFDIQPFAPFFDGF